MGGKTTVPWSQVLRRTHRGVVDSRDSKEMRELNMREISDYRLWLHGLPHVCIDFFWIVERLLRHDVVCNTLRHAMVHRYHDYWCGEEAGPAGYNQEKRWKPESSGRVKAG